jgi:hypothetical protein
MSNFRSLIDVLKDIGLSLMQSFVLDFILYIGFYVLPKPNCLEDMCCGFDGSTKQRSA